MKTIHEILIEGLVGKLDKSIEGLELAIDMARTTRNVYSGSDNISIITVLKMLGVYVEHSEMFIKDIKNSDYEDKEVRDIHRGFNYDIGIIESYRNIIGAALINLHDAVDKDINYKLKQ